MPHAIEANNQPSLPTFNIATSIKPLSLIITQLFPDNIEINQILPDGQDPHHQHLAFSQLRSLQKADLTVWFGPELESGLSNLMARQKPVLQLGKIPKLASSVESKHSDLHLWLDPDNVEIIAEKVTERVLQLRPQYRDYWLQNLERFKAELKATNLIVGEYLPTQTPIVFISEHNAFSHFATHFKLIQAGSLQNPSGGPVGPRAIARLQQYKQVDCVISESSLSLTKLEQLASHWNAKTLVIDPLGRDIAPGKSAYSDLLIQIASQFAKCRQLTD